MRELNVFLRTSNGAARRAALTGLLAGALVLTSVLSGCSAPSPLTVLDPGTAPQADADQQAERLVLVLEALELRYAVSSVSLPGSPLGPFVPAERAAEELMEHVALGSQSRAYISAHAAYLEDEWDGRDRPSSVAVVADDVTVVGTTGQDPVARVVVTTTYGFDDAPATATSAEYAISWSSRTSTQAGSQDVSSDDAAGADDAEGAGSAGGEPVRLDTVHPLYGVAGRPALDSGEGKGSPSGAVHDYLRAVTHGSSRDVDVLEGTIHTSDELRESLKVRLVASPRYTPVEIPVARMGTMHVMYVVPASGDRPVRLEVTVTDDASTVVPRL